jgi:hypothetical protein
VVFQSRNIASRTSLSSPELSFNASFLSPDPRRPATHLRMALVIAVAPEVLGCDGPKRAQYLSLLADVVIFFCCALCIRLVLVRYVDWSVLQGVFELQWVNIQATVTAVVLRRPPPESIIGPYQYLRGREWIRLCKVHDDDGGGLYLILEKFRLADAPPYNALSYTWDLPKAYPKMTTPPV